MSPSTSNPPAPSGDAEIIRLIVERKSGGLQQLLTKHGARVRGGLVRSFGDSLNAAELDDAMSKATYKAWNAADSYDPAKGSLRAWFYVIARNAGVEILRDRKRRRWETRGEAVEELGTAAATAVADDPDTDEAPAPSRFLEVLRNCIKKLPRLQRNIIEADLLTGDVADAGELAHRFKTTKNSIYASRSMARKALKGLLVEQGIGPGETTGQPSWN